MNEDHTTVTPGSGNIFADLGLPDAAEHLFKAQIVALIDTSTRSRHLTQAMVAECIGLKQPTCPACFAAATKGSHSSASSGFSCRLDTS